MQPGAHRLSAGSHCLAPASRPCLILLSFTPASPLPHQVILGAGYDDAADIWSLACMVFELVTGECFVARAQALKTRRAAAHHAVCMLTPASHTPLTPLQATCSSTPSRGPTASGARTRTTLRRRGPTTHCFAWLGVHSAYCRMAPASCWLSAGFPRPSEPSQHTPQRSAPLASADDGGAAADPHAHRDARRALAPLLH